VAIHVQGPQQHGNHLRPFEGGARGRHRDGGTDTDVAADPDPHAGPDREADADPHAQPDADALADIDAPAGPDGPADDGADGEAGFGPDRPPGRRTRASTGRDGRRRDPDRPAGDGPVGADLRALTGVARRRPVA
jgi:hypothetical protein